MEFSDKDMDSEDEDMEFKINRSSDEDVDDSMDDEALVETMKIRLKTTKTISKTATTLYLILLP
ncbi:hypothetical protein GQ43DRAFT_438022 [Delitschia confertaspora ATCC 74209]|uniref:Uncharacterized protein n=1 Tax=Delitschia confertaspora ATCC 74209 TaxID=1513339 RepID=A0A9P4JXK3_9PLEO|nr:hypothetical protein GQ43DRAFT_438022 [Delitschia confertaspora ATCC 74209]